MKFGRSTRVLAITVLVLLPSGGCLSLFGTTREYTVAESAETRQRLFCLENRVSVLEAAAASRPSQPAPATPCPQPSR
jgi:hypothetical protein